MASHFTDGGDVMGLGKYGGNIPTSIQAALLKYITCILLHIYRACFVVRLPISNMTGNQPWHTKEKSSNGAYLFLERTKFISCAASVTVHQGIWLHRYRGRSWVWLGGQQGCLWPVLDQGMGRTGLLSPWALRGHYYPRL